MKNRLILLVSIAFLGISCNSDDDTNNNSQDSNFVFPITEGNYWTYDATGTDFSERDSLYVTNDTVVEGSNYKKMKARPIPYGLFSISLDNNALRYNEGKVMMTGNAAVGLGSILPLELNISNFILLDANASDNQQLSSISGTTSQVVEEYTLDLSYTLKSIAGTDYPTYTAPDGTEYTNVKSVTVILNLQITVPYTFAGVTVDIPVLAAQDVITSERFFADGIGMVYSQTLVEYELMELPEGQFTIPIPPSASEISHETLHSYHVE